MSDNAPAMPQRRRNRLSCIRYNENGAYFITICARDRANLFWNNPMEYVPAGTDVGAALRRPPEYLNPSGIAVIHELDKFDGIYQGILSVDNYVVMPNHVHLLLSIHPEKVGGRRNAAPTISSVVNQFKGSVTKRIGLPCWQKSFHDHVVRNEREYRMIWEYIDNNPAKWAEDRYYISPND